MFSIGIEFSLFELLRVKWVALVGGPLGIVLSAVLGFEVGGVLGWPPLQGLVDGTVFYFERLALPPSAVVDVELRDTARADAPARKLATQRIPATQGPPFKFALSFPATDIAPLVLDGRSAEEGLVPGWPHIPSLRGRERHVETDAGLCIRGNCHEHMIVLIQANGSDIF